jgi:hypothetical protein
MKSCNPRREKLRAKRAVGFVVMKWKDKHGDVIISTFRNTYDRETLGLKVAMSGVHLKD